MSLFEDMCEEETRRTDDRHSSLAVRDYLDTLKQYLVRYLHKDTEEFEQIWRINGNVPNRDQFFYQQFPKKLTSLDSEHHYSNFNMYGYCSRWFPKSILNILFPFHDMVYQQQTSRKLMTKGVPTSIECQVCKELDGIGIWDRSGVWNCVKSVEFDQDEFGDKFFENYQSYCLWRKFIDNKIKTLLSSGDLDSVNSFENLKKGNTVPNIIEH